MRRPHRVRRRGRMEAFSLGRCRRLKHMQLRLERHLNFHQCRQDMAGRRSARALCRVCRRMVLRSRIMRALARLFHQRQRGLKPP